MTSFDSTTRDYGVSALSSFVVTPHATNPLTNRIRMVTIGGGGTIGWVNWDGETCQTAALPEGSYPMFASRILVAGTTATDITGWV